MPTDIVPIVLLGAGVLLLLLIVSWRVVARHRKEMQEIAHRFGLEFSPRDPFSTHALPFKSFRRYGSRVNNVLWGTAQGIPVRIFQYWYTTTSGSGDSHSSTHHHYRCGLVELPVDCPHVVLARENAFTRVGSKLGLGGVETGADAFDRTFRVRCEDERFARRVLTPELRDWLVGLEGRWAFEITGPHALCMHRGRLRPRDVPEVVRVLVGLGQHLQPALQRAS